jgi:hypothetical protein
VSAMDVLAAMCLYLASIAGIVGALAISFIVYFTPPHHAASAQQTVAMTVQQNASSLGPQRASGQVVSTVAQSARAKTKTAASPAQVQAMRGQYFRRLVQEGRANRWAYQQDPSFENRFLGYAD